MKRIRVFTYHSPTHDKFMFTNTVVEHTNIYDEVSKTRIITLVLFNRAFALSLGKRLPWH